MKVAFISYWGVEDGLFKATVLPHLKVLSKLEQVKEIRLISVERSDFPSSRLGLNKVSFHPVLEISSGFIGKIKTIREISKKLRSFDHVDVVFARSSLAAIPVYFYHKKSRCPFVVESFEPHADYMVETGEWKRGGVKDRILRYFEKKECQKASYLLPVSENYKITLEKNGVDPSKLMVLPCTVDLELFNRNINDRERIRQKLGLEDKIVGIYVGKFGGLYEEEKAFQIFEESLSQFSDFHLLILSPQSKDMIEELAKRASFSSNKMTVMKVDSEEVPQYLSAADIAFATYKTIPSNQYLSPIKLGEYFANELFVICSPGVGDDAGRLSDEGIGITTHDLKNLKSKFESFDQPKSKEYALKNRNRDLIKDIYGKIIESLERNS